MPPWQAHSLLLPKAGAAWRECEDAFAYCVRGGACAVADGATEAFGARRWARLLVRAWVRAPVLEAAAFLELARRLGERNQQHWAGRPLPWYAQEKREQGSYAAFLGVRLEPAAGGFGWRAIAIGDCCLLHWRGAGLIGSVPLSDPAQFGFRPTLLPSRPAALAACAPALGEFAGSAVPGDVLLLVSDAVACWLLAEAKGAKARAQAFLDLLRQGRPRELAALVAAERAAGRMRNDDVAALALELAPA